MRAAFWVAVILLAATALVGLGRLMAEDKAKKSDTPRTRIALVNLTYVIKKYYKYRDFQEEVKEIIEPFQRKDASLRTRLEKLRAEAAKVMEEANKDNAEPKTIAVKKESLETQAKLVQREQEDNTAEAKLVLGKRNDNEMRILFLDVVQSAQLLAKKHDFDIVLHYNDATEVADYYSTQNVARKAQTGALFPLTSTPGIDISKDVVDALNNAE